MSKGYFAVMPFRNLFKINTTWLFCGVVWLVACSPLSIFSSTPRPESPVKPPTPALTATPIPFPTQTKTATLMPTPDLWEIQKCHKAPHVLKIEADWIWQYTGDIDRNRKVEMILNFTEDNQILGFAFDYQNVREYQVSGCLEERQFTLWLQQENSLVATIV